MPKNTFSMSNETLAKMPKSVRDEVLSHSADARKSWDDDQLARKVNAALPEANALLSKKLTEDEMSYVGVSSDRFPNALYLKTRQSGTDDRLTVTDGDLKSDGCTGFTDGKTTVKPRSSALLDAINVSHYFNKTKYATGAKRPSGVKACNGKCNSRDRAKSHSHGDQSQRQIVADAGKLSGWRATFKSPRKPEPASAYIRALAHPSDNRKL